MRTFLYTIDEGVEIKHVFTCNRPALQTGADHLFREIQRRVPMAWQGAKTKLAAGRLCPLSYASYVADRRLQGRITRTLQALGTRRRRTSSPGRIPHGASRMRAR